jgi:anti-anti-sigma factor
MDVGLLGNRLIKVTLNGRLDTQGVDLIEPRFIGALAADADGAVIDLSQVEFVASMGIRMLVSAAQQLRKRQKTLAVYGAPPLVMRVFEAVSLQKILRVCATEAEAVQAATASPA